ncbi:MAG: hypothetical protein JSU00_10695 [Acidobacteria bacterium]|nr:hypothetical protein [Acidobacteriota bacterium]
MAKDPVCPSCGARDIRVAHARGLSEHILELVGVFQLRCKRCQTRFRGSISQPSQVMYARCPKCYRMELSTWSEQYYNADFTTRCKLRLGATPYRCEFCRCNFASFRACRERFLWRNHRGRRRPAPVEPAPAVDSADANLSS